MEETSYTRTQVSFSLSDYPDPGVGSLKDLRPTKSILRTDSLETRASLQSPQSEPTSHGGKGGVGVAKVRNFQAAFLPSTLWPELTPGDQLTLKRNLSELQIAYSAEVKEQASLKSSLSRSCTACSHERQQRKATEVALQQAVQLTHTLLAEVYRLDSEVVAATQGSRSKNRKA